MAVLLKQSAVPEGSTWDITISVAGAALSGTIVVTPEGAPEPVQGFEGDGGVGSFRPAVLAQAFARRLELARVCKPLVRGGGSACGMPPMLQGYPNTA